MPLVKRIWSWLTDHPWLGVVAIFVLAIGVMQYENSQQDERERKEDRIEIVTLAMHDARTECQTNNQARQLIREIGVKLATAPSEALITVVADETNPALIEQYRALVEDNANATVAVLETRDCEAEVDEAKQTAAETLGLDVEEIPDG